MLAGGLWIGCAVGGTERFLDAFGVSIGVDSGAGDGGRGWTVGLLIVTSLIGLVALLVAIPVALPVSLPVAIWRGETRERMPWIRSLALTLVGASAIAVGVAARIAHEKQIAKAISVMTDTNAGSEDGTAAGSIVVLEATIASGLIETAFGSDLLAHHFGKPVKQRCTLRALRFRTDDDRWIEADPGAEVSMTLAEGQTNLRVGERIRITGRFTPVRAPSLPWEYDFRRIAAARGLIGSIQVDGAALVETVSHWRSPTPFTDSIASLRETIRARLREGLLADVPDSNGPGSARAMLVALVLGDAEAGYRPIEAGFRAVGLAHILAISGFNLAVLGWVTACIAGLFIRTERMRAVPVAVVALLALWLMAPASSAVRSALMAIVGSTGASFARDWNGDAILAIAAITMLCLDPSQATNAGFQLSFACVLALRHLAPAIRMRWLAWMPRDHGGDPRPVTIQIASEFTSRAIAAGVAAFLVSVPIVLLHFGTVQPMGALLTFACAPLSTITLAIAYPKAIIGAIWPTLATPFGPIVWIPATMQMAIVDRAIEMGAGSIATGVVSTTTCVSMLVAICGWVLAPRRALRSACLVLMLSIVAWIAIERMTREQPGFETTMLAVGDGSSYIIRTPDHVMVYDGGSSSLGSVAARALIPTVIEAGGVVDTLVVSHPNLDHFSALADLVRYARVERMIVHPSFIASARRMEAVGEFLDTVRIMGVPIVTAETGDAFTCGAFMKAEVLWPSARFRSVRDNDHSLVLMIEHTSGTRMLLTGDIEAEPAIRLASRAREMPDAILCDVMELPHHGSWREEIVELIRSAAPSILLQSTARRRFDRDRFAPHLDAETVRAVTCRDATIRIRLEYDRQLVIERWDADFPGGWRCIGRRAIRAGPGSSTRDDAGSIEHDAVTDDPIAAVEHRDLEDRSIGRSTHHDGLARVAGVEHDAFGTVAADSHHELDARVIGNRLRERDLRGEQSVAGRIGLKPGEVVAKRHGSVDRDRRHESTTIDAPRRARTLRDPVVKLAFGNRRDGIAERSEGMYAVGMDEAAHDAFRDVVARARWRPHRGEQRVGEHEGPSTIRAEADVPTADTRSIRRREKRSAGASGLSRGECDGRHALDRDLPRAACRAGIGSIDRRGVEGLELDIVSERCDEAFEKISVRKEDSIARRRTLGRPAAGETDERDPIEVDRDRTDPAMVPGRLSERDLQKAGKKLSIVEFDDGGSRGKRTIEQAGPRRRLEGDHLVVRNARARDPPSITIDRLEYARSPGSIIEKDPCGNRFVGMGAVRGDQEAARDDRARDEPDRGVASDGVQPRIPALFVAGDHEFSPAQRWKMGR
jgi:ComEC/Rec2-related protein